MKFNLVDYNTWGNEFDGYEVNTIYKTDVFIDIVDDNTDQEIIDKLIEADYLVEGVKAQSDLIVDWLDNDIIELVVAKNDCPFCRLERV